MNTELRDAIASTAADLGIDPVDLATVFSYETGGSFHPWQKGPTTKWGQHRGLIQWGVPQRQKYGVSKRTPVADQVRAAGRYLQDAGVQPGMGLLDVYSAVNAGKVGRYDASDEAAGGAPGTVRDKVQNQMAGHRKKAEKLMAGIERKPLAPVGGVPALPEGFELEAEMPPLPEGFEIEEDTAPMPKGFEPEQASQQEGFGTLTGTTPGVGERIGNALYDAGKAIGLPVDRMRRDNAAVDAAVRGAADTASFGFADEIAAGMGAATGIDGEFGNYEGNLDYQRAVDTRDAEINPTARMGGQLVGGVATGMVAGPAAPALNTMGRIKQGAGMGTAYGGLYGFGSGEGGVQNRARNSLSGAAVGAGVGAMVPAATAGISKGYNVLMGVTARPVANAIRSTVNPTSNAMQLTQRALRRDGLSPEQAAAKMNEAIAAGDDSMMMVDVGGDNTRRLARYATNIPGPGANTIKDKVFERQLAQPDRVISAVRKGMKDPEEYHQTLEDLIASREAYAGPMYEKALKRPIVWNDRLGEFFADPIFKQGLAQGAKIQRLESLAKGEKFDPFDYAITGFDDAGDPIIAQVPNMRTVNIAKKGFDVMLGGMKNPITGKLTEEGRAVDMVRRKFLEEIDASNPAYRDARSVFGSHIDAQFAVERGKDLMKADAETARRAFAKMSDADKEFARVGVAKAIIDDISKAKDGMDTVRKIFGSPRQRQVFEAVFPTEDGMNEFRKAMFREGQKTRTKAAVTGNSSTAQQAGDIADNQIDIGVVSNLFSGKPVAAMTAAFQKALARATVTNEAVAKEIADILTTTDPKVAQQVIAEMQRLSAKDARIAKNFRAVQNLLRNAAIVDTTKGITDATRVPVLAK